MKSQKILYLSREDVESIDLPMIEIIAALEEMFREKGAGRIEMPPKPGIHPKPNAFLHAMPAYIPKSGAAGIKWVSAFPDNPQKRLPYISGLIILNDPDTGIPLCVMDATWITAKRTGAATAVAAKYLARQDSSSVGILACGVQGRSNLEALACLFEIDRVLAFDISPDAAKKYAQDMEKVIPGEIKTVDHPRDAVAGMDLVVTSGPILKKPDPIIEAGWLSEGSFASLVDFDSYWKGDALREADKFATDDQEQWRTYKKGGYFQDSPLPYADLGEIVTGNVPGREQDQERCITMNLGLAAADMVAARAVYNKATKLSIGKPLDL